MSNTMTIPFLIHENPVLPLQPDMDCLNHQCDMQIQACTYEDHMALGPGQCPIVLIFNRQQ
jgi:hypothetical protein